MFLIRREESFWQMFTSERALWARKGPGLGVSEDVC